MGQAIQYAKNIRITGHAPLDMPSFEENSREVVGYLRSRFHWDASEAETIFHDAYLLSLQHMQEGRIKEISKAYLKNVAQKIGANLSRKCTRKLHFVSIVEEMTDNMEQRLGDKYGIQIFDEPPSVNATLALRAFSMLEEHCQQLIKLRYIEELNHEAIVQRLGRLTKNGSKNQLSRCLKYWKKMYRGLLKS